MTSFALIPGNEVKHNSAPSRLLRGIEEKKGPVIIHSNLLPDNFEFRESNVQTSICYCQRFNHISCLLMTWAVSMQVVTKQWKTCHPVDNFY